MWPICCRRWIPLMWKTALILIWIICEFMCVLLMCVCVCTLVCAFGLTQCENLPKENAVWPHITEGGVQIMENTFWCHPLQGQEGLSEKEKPLHDSMWDKHYTVNRVKRVQFADICFNCGSTSRSFLLFSHNLFLHYAVLTFKFYFHIP